MSNVDLQRQIDRLVTQVDYLITNPASRTLGEMYGMFLGLPGLRGFWPMGSHTQTSGELVYDLSGQGRSLTRNGAEMRNTYNGYVPYADFNGTTDYLSRADENDLDITLSLTMLGWFWYDSVTGSRPLMSKWGAGAATRSYNLTTNSGALRVALSTGAAVTTYDGGTVTNGAWNFLVGRFTPSSTVDLFVNSGVPTSVATAVATLGNSASPFRIGNDNDANFLDGRAGPCALCAHALSDNLINMIFQRSRTFFGV